MERNDYGNRMQREPRSMGKLLLSGVASIGQGFKSFVPWSESSSTHQVPDIANQTQSTEAALQADWHCLSEDSKRIAQDTAKIAFMNTRNE